MCEGVAFMHDRSPAVMHRDLKALEPEENCKKLEDLALCSMDQGIGQEIIHARLKNGTTVF